MPAKMKLIYFNSRGRAEAIRYIFAQAGVEYEDCRLEKEQWAELKPKIPFGQCPVLEYKGEYIGQSMAIARFVARELNLAGKDILTTAKADFIVDCITDCFNKAIPIFYEQDETKKKEMAANFFNGDFKTFLEYLTSYMKANKGAYLTGSELTYADFVFASILETFEGSVGDSWKKMAPELGQLFDKINNLPNIKKWRESRPKTER